jgi:putative transposase
VPVFLSTDWILAQFSKKRAQAQKQYREFVRDGVASRPWEELKGQIYLGSEAFIEKHAAPNKALKEIPRVQLRAAKPSLVRIFAKSGDRAIADAYDHGYRLHEIAAHLGVHYATVSRRLKQIEQAT